MQPLASMHQPSRRAWGGAGGEGGQGPWVPWHGAGYPSTRLEAYSGEGKHALGSVWILLAFLFLLLFYISVYTFMGGRGVPAANSAFSHRPVFRSCRRDAGGKVQHLQRSSSLAGEAASFILCVKSQSGCESSGHVPWCITCVEGSRRESWVYCPLREG